MPSGKVVALFKRNPTRPIISEIRMSAPHFLYPSENARLITFSNESLGSNIMMGADRNTGSTAKIAASPAIGMMMASNDGKIISL